jgi:hypothetical protein
MIHNYVGGSVDACVPWMVLGGGGGGPGCLAVVVPGGGGGSCVNGNNSW